MYGQADIALAIPSLATMVAELVKRDTVQRDFTKTDHVICDKSTTGDTKITNISHLKANTEILHKCTHH